MIPFGLSLRAAAVSGGAELVVLPRVVPLPGGRSLGSGIGSEGSVPHMVALHGEDDQIVPIQDSTRKSAKLIENATEVYYPGAPHGLTATHQDQVNAELLAFLRS